MTLSERKKNRGFKLFFQISLMWKVDPQGSVIGPILSLIMLYTDEGLPYLQGINIWWWRENYR